MPDLIPTPSKLMTVGDLITALMAFDIDMPVIIASRHKNTHGTSQFAMNIFHPDEKEAVIDIDGPDGEDKAVLLEPNYDAYYII